MGHAFITRRGGGGTDISGVFTTLISPSTYNYYQAKLTTTTTYLNFATITVDESIKDVIVLCQFVNAGTAVFLTKPGEEVSCPAKPVSTTVTATLYYEREGTNLNLYVKKDSTTNGTLNVYVRVIGR